MQILSAWRLEMTNEGNMADRFKITDLRTPAFMVDLKTVQSNCKAMIDRCKGLGVELRTNMKTHRTL